MTYNNLTNDSSQCPCSNTTTSLGCPFHKKELNTVMNTSALEVFRSDCNLAGHHQMVAKFQQEIFRGRFSSRVFPVLTSTAESLLRHFLEWALETLKHESRFIGPVGSFQNGRIGTQQLQKKDGTDGVTVNLVKSRCSGKDS